ncbi:hypothetical protein BDV93DRAFT_526511 [Ceratobasidium sp. AG-I]|nr:hypothetical protein BDV93DRAFT_526511 [Ceratobasidium sp. AG-I]
MPPRKRPSIWDQIEASPDPSRPATPEPTTSSGVLRGRALYDSPLPDSQTNELGGRSQRRRRSTSRGITWAEEIEKSATRSNRIRCTRARNAEKKKAQSSAPGAYDDAEGTDGGSQGTPANPLTSRLDDEGHETDEVPESVAAPEPEESAHQESSAGVGSSSGEHVYINRQKFIAVASAALGEDLSNESTQALQNLYNFRSAYETPPLDATSRDSLIVMLPGEPLGIGGGWHQSHPANNIATVANSESGSWRARKRRLAASDADASDAEASNPDSAKRQRTETISIDDSNTNTISESDFELEPFPPPLFPSTPLPSASDPSATPVAPPPHAPVVRTDTQTTQLETQLDPLSPARQYLSTGSVSLGGSHYGSRVSHYSPRANIYPPNSPVVARLRATLQGCENGRDSPSDAPENNPATAHPSQPQPNPSAQPSSRTYSAPEPASKAQSTARAATNMTDHTRPNPAGNCTYLGSRSHVEPNAEGRRASSRDTVARPLTNVLPTAPTQPTPCSQANSRSQTTTQSQATSSTQATSRAHAKSRALSVARTQAASRAQAASHALSTAGYWPASHSKPLEAASSSTHRQPSRPRPISTAPPTSQAPSTLHARPALPTQTTSRAQRWVPHTPTPIPEPRRRPRPDPNAPSIVEARPTTSSQRPTQQHSQYVSRNAQPSPNSQRSVRGVQDRRPGVRDPATVAKAAMVEFNRAEAQDEARKIAESAARHIEHIERERERRSPSPSYRLLEDDEEVRACAKAVVSGIPKVCRRKKKPVASDSTGLSGQVLTLGKLSLFGLACARGPYQTRGRLLHWARLVHEETWNTEAPDVPYVAATQSELEVMVNNLASLRGRVKEYLRVVIVTGYGFRQFAVSQEDIQFNRDLYATLCPNNFHCTEFSPRSGHYENEEIFNALAAGLFNGPNSVGALFEEYFERMPLPVVAFILAMMQFCIEEWSNRWFEPKDLSAGNMLDKYEAHLFSLKEALAVAPGRITDPQADLFTFAQDYSCVSTSCHSGGQERIHRSEIRPDTPPPVRDEDDVPAEVEGKGDVPVEFNNAGRLTARAKGKGRARR